MGASQVSRQLQDHFGVKARSVELVKQKTGRHVYEIRVASGNLFLKLAVGAFSRARIAEEASLLAYLDECAFSAPKLVTNATGERLFDCTLDGAPACGYLTEGIEIAAPWIDTRNEAHLRLAGRKLAEFHAQTGSLASDFTVVSWNHRWVVDSSLRNIEPLFDGRRSDFVALCGSFEGVKERISRSWKKTDGAWGIIHGDWHAANVVLGSDGDLWFLDFESFGNGWRITDVMVLLGSRIETGGALDLQALRDAYRVFMDAYTQRGPSIGDPSSLPTDWLAVRFLLHFGRQVPEAGFDATRGARWLDAFLDKVDVLTRGS